MQTFYADLHVHLGAAAGRPVKISASRALTLQQIAVHATEVKGLDLVGIVDACCAGGVSDLQAAVAAGTLQEQAGGGFVYKPTRTGKTVVIIPGCEVEIREPGLPAVHWLAYFATLDQVTSFAEALAQAVRNPYLSTQRTSWQTAEFVDRVVDTGGVAMPAHAFTPHKGLFGAAVARFADVLPPRLLSKVNALELGLSANSAMADRLAELHSRTLLSNSDAHSVATIGREHNKLRLAAPTFTELCLALAGEAGRAVTANYGLDPRLGKYYRTTCLVCAARASTAPPVLSCPVCGTDRVVTGVADRIAQLASESGKDTSARPQRPPYISQVPLRQLPGLGPRRLAKLIARFGSELAVLHEASAEQLLTVVEPPLVQLILAARHGRLRIEAGGGGNYGRVTGVAEPSSGT